MRAIAQAAAMRYLSTMNLPQLARRVLVLSPVLVVIASTGSASARNEIEGVWSFNGGAVAIQPLSDGTYQGTVVTSTTFATCEHPAEQVMWTDMRPQPDGSFWGLHQWYSGEGTSCKEDPVLGPTTWRVLHEPDGARYLKVCFSHPSTSQPKIAPDGTATEDTFSCEKSALVSTLPQTGSVAEGGTAGTIQFGSTVILPNTRACISQRSLNIVLKDPKYDPLKEVAVRVNGKKVFDVKGVKRLKRRIMLKKLPSGSYKVSVTAITVLKQRLRGSRTYKSCTRGSGKITLKRSKSHRSS